MHLFWTIYEPQKRPFPVFIRLSCQSVRFGIQTVYAMSSFVYLTSFANSIGTRVVKASSVLSRDFGRRPQCYGTFQFRYFKIEQLPKVEIHTQSPQVVKLCKLKNLFSVSEMEIKTGARISRRFDYRRSESRDFIKIISRFFSFIE